MLVSVFHFCLTAMNADINLLSPLGLCSPHMVHGVSLVLCACAVTLDLTPPPPPLIAFIQTEKQCSNLHTSHHVLRIVSLGINVQYYHD